MYAKGVAGGNSRLGYYILMKPTFVAERWFFLRYRESGLCEKEYFVLFVDSNETVL